MSAPADTRDARFAAAAAGLGHGFDGELRIGGNYTPPFATATWST
jgi:hypothetical protein